MSFGEKFLNRKKKPKEREVYLSDYHLDQAINNYLHSMKLIDDNEQAFFDGGAGNYILKVTKEE